MSPRCADSSWWPSRALQPRRPAAPLARARCRLARVTGSQQPSPWWAEASRWEALETGPRSCAHRGLCCQTCALSGPPLPPAAVRACARSRSMTSARSTWSACSNSRQTSCERRTAGGQVLSRGIGGFPVSLTQSLISALEVFILQDAFLFHICPNLSPSSCPNLKFRVRESLGLPNVSPDFSPTQTF